LDPAALGQASATGKFAMVVQSTLINHWTPAQYRHFFRSQFGAALRLSTLTDSRAVEKYLIQSGYYFPLFYIHHYVITHRRVHDFSLLLEDTWVY